MTQFQTDFEEYTPDVQPSDWTEQGATADSEWVVRDDGQSPTDQHLEHTRTGADARRALSWDAVDGDADRDDVESLVKFRSSSTTGFQFYFRLRGSGGAGSETAYNLIQSNTNLLLHKYVAGASTNLDSTANTISADTFYWIRFRVNGSTLKGKIWQDGDPEPGTWGVEDTDTDITGVGFAGLGSFESTGVRDYDFFSVATNGETALGPPEAASDVRDTQSAFLVMSEGTPDTRSTQSSFLVLFEDAPDTRATQSPLLVLAQFLADTRSTQTIALAVADVVDCLTKWAQTWTITRTDGQVFAFTSLDRDLTFRGVVHHACDSLAATATEMSSALGSTGSMELQGLISDSSIKDTDLFNGVFDGAFVEIWSVPWENTGGEIPFRLLAGTLGDVTQGTVGFTAEIISPSATLQQKPLLDTYAPGCPYKLGDERCGFDLDTLEVAGAATSLPSVTAPNSGARRVFTDSSRAEADGFYEFGELTWTSGDNVGVSSDIKDFSGGTFTLWTAALNNVQIGDAYTAKPGCDKTVATCKTKFDIFVNYGGFPDVPGQDRILSTPDAK